MPLVLYEYECGCLITAQVVEGEDLVTLRKCEGHGSSDKRKV